MVSYRNRYQTDHGRTCIDIHLKYINQLFDSMDPSPFLERDLDEDASTYIVAAAMEHSLRTPVVIRIHLDGDRAKQASLIDPKLVSESIHNHFAYNADLAKKKIRLVFREGQFTFVIGLLILTICLSVSQSPIMRSMSQPWHIIREGLTIFGWVAMWRPIDVFLYSWWPQMEMRKVYLKLSKAAVELKVSKRKDENAPRIGVQENG